MEIAAAAFAAACILYHRQKKKSTNKKNKWVVDPAHHLAYNVAMPFATYETVYQGIIIVIFIVASIVAIS